MKLRGEFAFVRVPGPSLEGNPLGDPHERHALVYLPPGYGEGARRYPVVLMLPGFAGNHVDVVSYDPWKPSTLEALDAQMVAGACPPAIVVVPDCTTFWGGSQFLDAPSVGRYQTYLAEDVLGFLDANYRTIPETAGRAAVGRSSGGFGALRLAMDRPGTIAAVASHAGDALFDVTMRPMLTNAATAIARAGGVAAFVAALREGGPKGFGAFDAAFVLASAACYAPTRLNDVRAPRLPVRATDAAFDAEVWAEWLAHDPVHRVAGAQEALAGLRYVFLDAGDSDEHGLHFAAAALETRLSPHVARVEHERFAGGHRGTSYRYATSLPRVIGALADG